MDSFQLEIFCGTVEGKAPFSFLVWGFGAAFGKAVKVCKIRRAVHVYLEHSPT